MEDYCCDSCLRTFKTARGLATHTGMTHREENIYITNEMNIKATDDYEADNYEADNHALENIDALENMDALENSDAHENMDAHETMDAHDCQQQPSYAPFASEEELALAYWHYAENTTAGALDRMNAIGIYNETGTRIQYNKQTLEARIKQIPILHPHLNAGSFTSTHFGLFLFYTYSVID